MTPKRLLQRNLARAAGLLAVFPFEATACSVCFGNPDSDLTRGMNMGVLALLVILLAVLGSVAAFMVFLARRASTHPLPTAQAALRPVNSR
jgi:hypothetical protein